MRFAGSLSRIRSEEYQQYLRSAGKVGVTIGNFDGVHLGHQQLFDVLAAEVEGVETAVRVLLTFAPHPRRVLDARSAEELRADPSFSHITSMRRKVELAADAGFDLFVLIRFTKSFAALTPREFVSRYLVEGLHADTVVVGYDWSFGRQRAGTVDTLRELGDEFDFTARIVQEVLVDGERVSSSLVKEALLEGDLERLRSLLGRSFEVQGLVVHGEKRGRELGFPTANLHLPGQLLPPDGVYAAFVRVDGKRYPAAVNLGVRPQFERDGARLLEVHCIGEQQLELYGKRLQVEFVQKLRDEKRFNSVDELVRQMRQDVEAAARLLPDR